MAGYIGSKASVVSSGAERKKTFAITTTTTALTGLSYTPTKVHVFHNGVRLVDGTDFTATNSTSITLTVAAESGDQVVVVSYASFQTSDTVSASAGGTFANSIDVTGTVTADGLTVNSGTNNIVATFESTDSDALIEIKDSATSDIILFGASGDDFLFRCDAGNILYKVNNNATTAMVIDSSGNLLVGKTALSSSTDGFQFSVGSSAWAAMSNSSATSTDELLLLNRTGSDGEFIQFKRGATTVGNIGSRVGVLDLDINTAGSGRLSAGGTGVMGWNTGLDIFPHVDNVSDVGTSGNRWDDIYATNGTIQTSDRNEKQDVAALTATEMLVAARISGLFKTFRWIDSVADKGEDARTHTGVIAQDVHASFLAEGLDAGDYALFTSTTWWETQTDVAAVEADEDNEIEAADAYTRTDTFDTLDEAPDGATERTRMGIRYPELLAFVGSYNEQRFASIETRLAALEGN